MDNQSSDSVTSACHHTEIQRESAPKLQRSELSRLFIVCGRGSKVDELRALFSTCGAIKHLHLALDRSKKSRGFAFLEYEDSANAIAAIEKFDHTKLGDGQILKHVNLTRLQVTVAKERPVGGHGKLKRGQQTRQDLDEKTVEGDRGEDDRGSGARIPGKRQRSSPPILSLPLGQNHVKRVFLPEKILRREEFPDGALQRKDVNKEPVSPLPFPRAKVCKTELREEVQLQVEQVIRAVLCAVEQHETQSTGNKRLIDTYRNVVSTFGRLEKQEKTAKLSGSKQEFEDDNSTDSLASCIRSVSLVSTPATTRNYPSKAPENRSLMDNVSGVIPPRHFKHHLRRHRQSIDGSESSADNASDRSGGRRKRSYTTTSSAPMLSAQVCAKTHPISPRRKSSDPNVSRDAFKVDSTSKKQCKRQSSYNGLEESYRLAKQQATQERQESNGCMVQERADLTDVESSYDKDRDIKVEVKTEPAQPKQTKLFFTSTFKVLSRSVRFFYFFTEQELEAMFAVYSDFESVELVKSFGRVKTMAYIRFTKPTTAAFVVNSFQEESVQGDKNPERPEFMTLSFAHETEMWQRPTPEQFRAGKTSSPSSSFYLTIPPSTTPVTAPTSLSSAGKDRLWVLLLYNRFLATHMLSAVVSPLCGMEFMDIKVVRSTGEAEGVAFVKFDSDANAKQAALYLHQMELPLGSGKFLQAIVIQTPSLFSTTHGSTAVKSNESMGLKNSADERVLARFAEDTDLCAVEARFAHLMRSTEHPYTNEGKYFHPCSCSRCYGATTLGDQQSPTPVGVSPRSNEFSSSLSNEQEHYPMQFMTYPPPQPMFQPFASVGPGNYQQWLQHQAVGGCAPGWMETTPYYRTEIQKYPFSCAPERQMAYPFGHSCNSLDNVRNSSFPVSPRVHPSHISSERVNNEQATKNCSTRDLCSIHISTSKPLELVTLVRSLHDCSGVMSFAKCAPASGSDVTGFVVEFSSELQAMDAMHKLDGSLCGGQRLRVVRNGSTRQRRCGGGGKTRANSGRRKRQRVDPRNRK
ncbi:hypothetical protein PsorP6_005761 [Peronosclerospora sorghi]|uniref:Uncharacterized protein n=1 Tax=Peronosclerospora sorghi TaxID=230839 RepID=A0ACC0W3Y4_9STRA|nr:hypothetical protein PsorP6_005761 [Peronosclerospora sorghi]